MSNVTPIKPVALSDDSREIAASYLRKAMESLTVYAAALSTSKCEVAQVVGRRLGLECLDIYNDLDTAHEILDKGDHAIAMTGASKLE